MRGWSSTATGPGPARGSHGCRRARTWRRTRSRRTRRRGSTGTPGACRAPGSSPRARADSTSALVGMQATLMQLPPILSRSTMATDQPASARSIARDLPALPPPTTRSRTSSMSRVSRHCLHLSPVGLRPSTAPAPHSRPRSGSPVRPSSFVEGRSGAFVWPLVLPGTPAEDAQRVTQLGQERGKERPAPACPRECPHRRGGYDDRSAGAVRRADPTHPGELQAPVGAMEPAQQRAAEGRGNRARSVGDTPGNPEEVLDAVFDFAENLIAQQRNFAKQMLRAAERGQQAVGDVASSPGIPTPTTTLSVPEETTSPTTASSTSPTSESGR